MGAVWKLEMACCHAALSRIASFPAPLVNANYFINVSPVVFSDPPFLEEFTTDKLQEYGIDRKNIVIEITEEKAINNYSTFEKLIAHYTQEGFNIALDDFGSGHFGPHHPRRLDPHFLKLDMAIVRDVHKHDYKLKLVKAISSFASSASTPGLSRRRRMPGGTGGTDTVRASVRSGFLFGLPQPEPSTLPDDWRDILKGLVEKYDVAAVDLDTRISSLVTLPATVPANTML